MDVRERWNFVEGVFRDLDQKDLIEDFAQDDRTQLQDVLGGRIWFTSEENQYTTFSFTLPRARRLPKKLARGRTA